MKTTLIHHGSQASDKATCQPSAACGAANQPSNHLAGSPAVHSDSSL